MRTYEGMARQLDVPWCGGDCGIDASHERGFLFLGVVHFRERRWTRRGAKRFLMLVAERERLRDPLFLNSKRYGTYHLYRDAVRAQELAGQLGFRIPARAFTLERLRAKALSHKTFVAPSAGQKVRAWLAR